MSKNSNGNNQQLIEGELIPITPTPQGAKIRLSSVKDCRRELAKVYADARQGKIPSPDATRLTYILVAVSNMIKDHELEERVKKLEEQSEELRAKNR